VGEASRWFRLKTGKARLMNCKNVSEILIEFLSGELPPEQLELVTGHIDTCRYCQQELSVIRDIESSLKCAFEEKAAVSEIPENTLDNIKQQIVLEEQEVNKSSIFEKVQEMPAMLSQKISSLNLVLPNRKFIFAGALVISILVILLLGIPVLLESNDGLAAYAVALKDPQLQNVLVSNSFVAPDESSVKVINYHDAGGKPQAFVAFHPHSSFLIVADVDMSTKSLNKLNTLDLDDQTSQEVIATAGNDARIQALLEQGAIISNLYPTYVFYEMETVNPEGEVYKKANIDFIIQLRITIGSSEYMAIYDVNTSRVTTVVTASEMNLS
jgi:hypothetical protein